jgi:hypothetical protein
MQPQSVSSKHARFQPMTACEFNSLAINVSLPLFNEEKHNAYDCTQRRGTGAQETKAVWTTTTQGERDMTHLLKNYSK